MIAIESGEAGVLLRMATPVVESGDCTWC